VLTIRTDQAFFELFSSEAMLVLHKITSLNFAASDAC